MDKIRSLTHHRVFQAFLLRGCGLALGIAGSVAIARLGGADVKGVSSAFAATNSLVFLIVSLDLAQQILRDGRERGDLAGVVRRLISLWPFYALVAAIGSASGLWLGKNVVWLVVGAGAFLIGAQAAVMANALAGPSVASWGAVIQQATMVVGAFVAWWTIGLGTESVKLVVIASYLTPLPLFFWSFRSAPDRPSGRVSQPMSVPNLVRAGSLWQVARLSQFLMLRLDTLVVFSWLGASEAGIYSVGLATASLASILPAQFAANTTYEATLGITNVLRRNAFRAGLSGVAASLVLAVVGYPLLNFAYGPQFDEAYVVLLATLPGVTAYGVLQVITAQRRLDASPRSVTVPSALGAITMVIGLGVLVPRFGLVGAGVASSLAACTAVAVVLAQSRGHIRWSI